MHHNHSISHRLLWTSEVAIGVVVLAVATHAYGWGEGLLIALSLVIAYLVPRIVLARQTGASVVAHAILLVAGAMLASFVFLYLASWIDVSQGYTLAYPHLSSDNGRYYHWAWAYRYGLNPDGELPFKGYPMMIVGLWQVLGVSVVWPVALNVMLTLLAVVLTGMTTRRLLEGRVAYSPGVLLATGMGLMLLLSYYLWHGANVLKEPSLYFSLAASGYVLAGVQRRSASNGWRIYWGDVALFAIACGLAACVRPTYLYFVLLGVLMVAGSHWRIHWRIVGLLLCICLLALLVGNSLSTYTLARHQVIASGGWEMQRVFMTGASQQAYYAYVGKYFFYPWWQRVLMLPLSMGVQWVTPFPWLYSYAEATAGDIIPRLRWGWYAIGGIALGYYWLLAWRRQAQLGTWAWWPLVAWAAIAYLFAGTITRYALPMVPLFVPLAVYVLCLVASGRYRRPFVAWITLYAVALAVTLVLCYHIQVDYLQQLHIYYQHIRAALSAIQAG